MDKKEIDSGEITQQLSAQENWEKLYGKKLNCKKHILEYIDIIKRIKKENLSQKELEDTYSYIYEKIEGLRDSIKPNTSMYLKNTLKSEIGKTVKNKNPQQTNEFIEFFKKAYPKNERRRNYTMVLMDQSKLSEEQIWTTLVYINRECLKNNIDLSKEQKRHIIEIIEKVCKASNVKIINKIRNLQKLMKELNISIVTSGGGFRIRLN